MAVRDGAAHLPAQLDSLVAQTHADWHLIASDDGSTDDSVAILDAFAQATGRVTRLRGPGQGAAANFLFLLRYLAETGSNPGILAFADQDDVWLPHKLTRALTQLERVSEGPALYCSRAWITGADLSGRRLSAARPRPPGFGNALVQNIAQGATIVLNPAAARLAGAAAARIKTVPLHDAWLYALVTGAGGRVVHDDTPGLLYRQHGGNQIGAAEGTRARLTRLARLLSGHDAAERGGTLAALRATPDLLTEANRARLHGLTALPDLSWPARLRALRWLGLYRQGRAATLSLWLAALLNRL